jgi:hypothetical protein
MAADAASAARAAAAAASPLLLDALAAASAASPGLAALAGPEFADPRRLELVEQIHAVLPDPAATWSTAWACLWLAGLEYLEEFLRQAKNNPYFAAAFLRCVDEDARVVKACK